MSSNPPAHLDDRPLTLTEIHQFSAPNDRLARKIAAHLTGEWTVGPDDGSVRARLTGPEGATLVCYVTDRRGSWEAVVRGIRPADVPDGFGHFHWNGVDLPATTAPSLIADAVESGLLPSYQATLTAVRSQIASVKADTDQRRERAEVLAARLGIGWRVKEHPDLLSDVPRTYFSVERHHQQKQIFGAFTIEHGTQSTSLNLCNVSADTLNHIVEAVIDHQNNDGRRWRRWPRRLRRALLLMHQAGYSIDRIGPLHKHLFGEYLFKMDSHVGIGYPVVSYLRDRPDTIEQVIRLLDPDQKGQ